MRDRYSDDRCCGKCESWAKNKGSQTGVCNNKDIMERCGLVENEDYFGSQCEHFTRKHIAQKTAPQTSYVSKMNFDDAW